MTPTDDLLAEARSLYAVGRYNEACVAIDRVLLGPVYPRGAFLLRSQCLTQGNSNDLILALHNAEAEHGLDPDLPGLAEHLGRLRQALGPAPGPCDPASRPWATAFNDAEVKYFERCSQRHTYRAIPMIKNVFDLAVYPRLLWETKPRTIIEIGSFYGGSAVWMADLTGGYGLDTHIYSVDIAKVWTARHDRVTFLLGDGRNLAGVLSEDLLATLPRPWLVVEDADHSFETTAAVLNFFHPHVRSGEYLVVEDGMTCPPVLGALQQFFASHPAEYEVDPSYCDHFGNNTTWCVNGFLRRR